MDEVLQQIQSVADTIRGQILSLEERLQPILVSKGQAIAPKVDPPMTARTDLERELNEILDMVVQRKQMLEDLYSRICL